MKKYYTPSQVADMLSVKYNTVWRWIKEGKLRAERDESNRLRIPEEELQRFLKQYYPNKTENDEFRVAIYARVSSHKQRQQGDLDRQVQYLLNYAKERGWRIVAVIKDVGSGLKDTRPGLQKLFNLVDREQIDAVLIAHKDRLTRFNFGYLERYFRSHGVQIVVAEPEQNKEPWDELVEDFLAVVVHFAGKLYGMRSHYAKKLIEMNREFVEQHRQTY